MANDRTIVPLLDRDAREHVVEWGLMAAIFGASFALAGKPWGLPIIVIVPFVLSGVWIRRQDLHGHSVTVDRDGKVWLRRHRWGRVTQRVELREGSTIDLEPRTGIGDAALEPAVVVAVGDQSFDLGDLPPRVQRDLHEALGVRRQSTAPPPLQPVALEAGSGEFEVQGAPPPRLRELAPTTGFALLYVGIGLIPLLIMGFTESPWAVLICMMVLLHSADTTRKRWLADLPGGTLLDVSFSPWRGMRVEADGATRATTNGTAASINIDGLDVLVAASGLGILIATAQGQTPARKAKATNTVIGILLTASWLPLVLFLDDFPPVLGWAIAVGAALWSAFVASGAVYRAVRRKPARIVRTIDGHTVQVDLRPDANHLLVDGERIMTDKDGQGLATELPSGRRLSVAVFYRAHDHPDALFTLGDRPVDADVRRITSPADSHGGRLSQAPASGGELTSETVAPPGGLAKTKEPS